MNDKPTRQRANFATEFWQLIQVSTGLFLLYSMIAEIVVNLSTLIGGTSANQTAAVAPAVGVSVTIPLPDPIAELAVVCIVTGVITYLVLKYLCKEEWVQESVQVEECWEEVKWYNPWSWVKSIVCTVKEVLRWVLKQICRWVEIIVVILVITCIIVGIIVLA